VRPERVVLVCGTGTEVGKTWVGSTVMRALRGRGMSVAARKPAQSYDIDSEGAPLGGPTDADVLGAASGEPPGAVCPPSRSYHRAMAPPMAAESLGLPSFTVADLIEELAWPSEEVGVGLVEAAGGVRSPLASDGDTTDLLAALAPEMVLLVSDAGLGTINLVRLSMDALAAATTPVAPTVVVLDRFDPAHLIHRRNRQWLSERCGYRVVALPGEESDLVDLVADSRAGVSPDAGPLSG